MMNVIWRQWFGDTSSPVSDVLPVTAFNILTPLIGETARRMEAYAGEVQNMVGLQEQFIMKY